jgi:hypothetical protein
MALLFNRPTVNFWAKNPAQMWVEDETKLVLGLTTPKYNKNSIRDTPEMRQPPCQTAKVKDQIQILRVASVIHEFDYEISIPPNVDWLSEEAPWETIQARIHKIIPQGQPKPNIDYSKLNRIRLAPYPNAATIISHTLNHEMQHAIDFQWAAATIFLPWSEWIDRLSGRQNPFKCKNQDTIQWILFGGTTWFTMMKCYLEATDELGASFHKLDIGKPPILQFMGTMNDGKTAVIRLGVREYCLPVVWLGTRPHAYLDLKSVADYNSVHSVGFAHNRIPKLPPVSLSQKDIDDHEKEPEEFPEGFF